jgi:hypothetical protein
MLGESSFEKNQKNNKDLIQTNDEMNQKEKIFNYFHNVLKKKKFKCFFYMSFISNRDNSKYFIWIF